MKRIAVNPKLYFLHEGRTTLNDMVNYAQKHVGAVYEAAKLHGIEPASPLEFIYFGVSSEMDKEFDLQIALPVKDKSFEVNGFKFREASSFKCLSYLHKGDMKSLHHVYESIMEHVWNNSLKRNNEIREIYHHYEHPDSANNLTEIQIGLN